MSIGPYTLECVGFTQDSNANYNSEYGLLDVYSEGKRVNVLAFNQWTLGVIPTFHFVPLQMTPEKRVYLVNGQPQTMVAIHSVPSWDLYVVYEGTNPDNGRPIIKAFLNPLVGWIWAGLVVLIFGTLFALVPSLNPSTAAVRVPARSVPSEPALKGGRL